MLLLSLVCSEIRLLCTVGSDALVQDAPRDPAGPPVQTFPARFSVDLGDPWKATPNSTGMLKCLLSRRTKLPQPTVTIGATWLKFTFPLAVIGAEGSL